MVRTVKRSAWAAAIVLGVGVLAVWPRAGAAAQRSEEAARPAPAAATAPAAPSRFLAPEPQTVYDDGLQVTFGVAPDTRGRTVLSAASARVEAKKTIEPDQTTLDLATPDGDRLRLVARRDSITVQHGAETATLTLPATAQSLARMRKVLAGSGAARTFRALSSAVQARRAEPFFDGIVTSGALLGVLNGDVRAADALKARFAARRAPRVRPAAWQRTTQQCWDQYSSDAIRIYDDYDRCMHMRRWYDVVGQANCELIYVTRSELAFSWLVACNGGFFG